MHHARRAKLTFNGKQEVTEEAADPMPVAPSAARTALGRRTAAAKPSSQRVGTDCLGAEHRVKLCFSLLDLKEVVSQLLDSHRTLNYFKGNVQKMRSIFFFSQMAVEFICLINNGSWQKLANTETL